MGSSSLAGKPSSIAKVLRIGLAGVSTMTEKSAGCFCSWKRIRSATEPQSLSTIRAVSNGMYSTPFNAGGRPCGNTCTRSGLKPISHAPAARNVDDEVRVAPPL
ncbi:MAG: hypothetical protein K0S56_2778 [Microvirga sp.]|nr:hypothetical protein [Microvirga sp.]